MRLFSEQGFRETTIDDITSAARVSRTTFFRYFDSKADLLWNEFDAEAVTLRARLEQSPEGLPTMDAVRQAVVAVNHYQPENEAELRAQVNLVRSVPELAASVSTHYEAWERAISDFIALRTGQPADSLIPVAVGRAALAVCRTAYEQWAQNSTAELTRYLDVALRALGEGFADPVNMWPTEAMLASREL